MNTNKIAGATQEYGGKIRKNIAEATGDTEGQIRGAVDEATGNVKKNVGKLQDAVKDATDE